MGENAFSSEETSGGYMDEMSGDIFNEIREVLSRYLPMDGCPPMFYPEAIHNAIVLPRRAIMRATRCPEEAAALGTEEDLVKIITDAIAATRALEADHE